MRLSTTRGSLVLAALIAVALPAGAEANPDPVRRAMDAGRYEEARSLLESAPGREGSERLELLAEVCNRLGDYAAGIRYGEQAIAASPDSSNAHLQHAVAVRIKMQEAGRLRAMMSVGTYKKSLARARELDPNNLDAREEEIGFLAQAPGIAGGDLGRARVLAVELKALDVRRGRAMQIDIESAKGSPETVLDLYREALSADPDDHRLRVRFGYFLQRQERYREADAEFARVQQSDEPRVSLNAIYQRGRTRILGAYEAEQAVAFLQEFIDTRGEGLPGLPSPSAAYWRKGMAHEQLGQVDRARSDYEAALELDADNEEARKALAKLRKAGR